LINTAWINGTLINSAHYTLNQVMELAGPLRETTEGFFGGAAEITELPTYPVTF